MAKKQKKKVIAIRQTKRHGTSVYIKEPNKTGKYYKYDNKTPLDIYHDYYTQTQKNKKTLQQLKKQYQQGITHETKKTSPITPNKYLNKIRKQPQLLQNIQTGITTTKLTNNATTGQIRHATQQLLQTLVLDKQLLEILTQDENLNKLKTRFEHRIQIKGQKNETLMTTTIFNHTTKEVINKLNNSLRKGERINKNQTPTISNKLEDKGFLKPTRYKDGTVNHAEINIIFRKG